MKKNKDNLKQIFIIEGIILILIASFIGYYSYEKIKEENILKNEIVNLTKKDLLKDSFDIKIKTTGDYAYIENAIKEYYKTLADNAKLINNYLSNEDLIQILSSSKLQSDAPSFTNSYKILNDTRTNYKEALNKIIELCNEDYIKKLIDKEKVSSKHYDLYLDLMYTKEDLKVLDKLKKDIQETSNNLGVFLDKVESMIKFLETNTKYWYIEDGNLYFETTNLLNQYNNLYKDMNNFVKEKFSKGVENTSKDKSNI